MVSKSEGTNNSRRDDEWRVSLRKSIKAKERSTLQRVTMPELKPEVRNKNHQEVNIGLSAEKARKEETFLQQWY